MRNLFGRTLVFLLVIAAVVTSLRLLDWFGQTISVEGPRAFPSVEQLQHQLRPGSLYLPVYFPDYLEWPPWEILGQTSPYKVSILHIRRQDSDQVALAVRQTVVSVTDPIETRLEPFLTESRQTIPFHADTALLETGTCADGRRCSRISWTDRQQALTVILADGTEELLRIASSMGSSL